MNLRYRFLSVKLLTTTWLLPLITIAIIIGLSKGADSDTDEWSIEYNQRLNSSLTGAIRELAFVDDSDDIDTRFQPSFDSYNFDQPSAEGYRLTNSQSLVLPASISDSNAIQLERHKRDISWTFSTSQMLALDGSGSVTEEDSTPELVTNTGQSTTNIQITLTDFTDTTTIPSGGSTSTDISVTSVTYQVPNTTESIVDTDFVSNTENPMTVTRSQTTSTTSQTIISTTTTADITTTQQTTTVTTRLQVCTWTSWVPLGNCTPTCGTAHRLQIRSCIDFTTGQSCDSYLCGGGYATENATCSSSPPCETLTVTPQPSIRDPAVRMILYTPPDPMYFFEQTYRRIWISNKGYITFDTPFYARTMTSSTFRQISEQAIAAPFWTDLVYDDTLSSMTVNWFSSINASASDTNAYYDVIQSAIASACPTSFCSSHFAAARVVRINWRNLIYELPQTGQSINISFSTYLINTYEYEYSYYSYPLLRSYLAFDYSTLPSSLSYLRPFVGYRGKYQLIRVLNDPAYHQNAGFLGGERRRSFYVGDRFLSECEVSYLQETRVNVLYPWENLNDIITNPRFPCPCTFGQARVDGRFGRLFSETLYETTQHVICYGPMTNNWIRLGWTSKLLRAQTCCYNRLNGGLITSGYLAGSVLSNPTILFQRHSTQRRISFYDQCCSPSRENGLPSWDTCRLYYQLHPPSTCTGYRPPAIVTGVGDPHVNTIDNGQYTCHIQGVYVFAQTSALAKQRAENNMNRNISDIDLLYPDDLFQIHVRSVMIAPAIRYIERTHGYGSVFSSYTIISHSLTFVISNNQGRFGFTINNNQSLTSDLSNNLDYDFTNANGPNTNSSERYVYRVQQTNRLVMNRTITQLSLTLWSGLAIRCEIVGENLECLLTLPEKFRRFIEGLAGNFNGDPNDDLFNRQTNENIAILSSSNPTLRSNDLDTLSACQSWRVFTDTTPAISRPILPGDFVNWYYNGGSHILSNLSLSLSPMIINQTCSEHFECVHDYLIQVNPFTSQATASALELVQESRIFLAETQPTISNALPIKIVLPIDETNRNYTVAIDITAGEQTKLTGINTTIYLSNNGQHIVAHTSNFTIPMPNNRKDFVEVSMIIAYGRNSTSENYLNIIACLCTNNGTCDFQRTTPLTPHYELASCHCPSQYDGDLCELSYSGCTSGSACTTADGWTNDTKCVSLSPEDQLEQHRSYYCNGSCQSGYNLTNNYTCEDIDECRSNSSMCENGVCVNVIGSYTCHCSSGFRLHHQSCIDINECIEPNIDGSFPRRCANDSEVCINANGTYTCECNPFFNTNGTCIYNESLCQNGTCTNGSGEVICLHGTVNVNDICIPWCHSTCPEFCELMTGVYQCNCMKYAGYNYSDDGQRCLQCRELQYGYGCNETCKCDRGICNRNASRENDSCSCDPGYEPPLCRRLINACANNSRCDNMTEDCMADPGENRELCSCKRGYKRSNITGNCTDIDECEGNASVCNGESSLCKNTNGSYECNCRDGYGVVNGQCIDIDECKGLSTSCANYRNTHCVNIRGGYECQCNRGYSIEGDNVLNTNAACVPTPCLSACENGCISPAVCNPTTCRCTCPGSTLNLVVSSDPAKETCQCPGYPFVTYISETCDSQTSKTWFLLYYNLSLMARSIRISSSRILNLSTEISNILSGINRTCHDSCIQINETNSTGEYFTALNITLDSTERFQLANAFFINNTSNELRIRIIINDKTKKLESFSSRRRPCEECDMSGRGLCKEKSDDACQCFSDYKGDFCRSASLKTEAAPEFLETRKWIIIVAVISSVAGLLLIVSCFMCIVRMISKYRSTTITRKTRPSLGHGAYFIPRAHIPTMGTGGRDIFSWDGFSLSTNDERHNNTSESYPSSSSTTYNPTYRIGEVSEDADFTIFDNLEKHLPLSKSSIPRVQMIGITGTLNSFPRDAMDNAAGTFLDSNDLNETGLVTDMLEAMTKDDNLSDDFLEARNPNLIIPRTSIQPETTATTSPQFSFYHN